MKGLMMPKMLTEKNSKILLVIGVLLFILGIGVFLWKETFVLDRPINTEKVSQFGDVIGGIIGSIWSLAGVILFYVALTDQRTDIQINRQALNAQVTALNQQIKEFKLQRFELEETRKIFEEQSTTLKIQRFENTFFQLLSLHHELVDKLKFSKAGRRVANNQFESREMLMEACEDLNKLIKEQNQIFNLNEYLQSISEPNLPKDKYEAEVRIGSAYSEFYFKLYKQTLSHYFRNVYHIFKLIYKSDLIKSENKQFYASLMRAQLSSEEQLLILYNSLVKNLGYPNFLFLIKEFDILQNFDFGLISKYPFHKEIFDEYLDNVENPFL